MVPPVSVLCPPWWAEHKHPHKWSVGAPGGVAVPRTPRDESGARELSNPGPVSPGVTGRVAELRWQRFRQ
ncbi:hypothetical protein GCM10010531_39280 [Blastococcus jejuensis]|uniref:Uncharacterized protein n=1 Tax=Blastococcus jejuensis TaxID=351224 RepID=A0ABP6PKF5_9ACTN